MIFVAVCCDNHAGSLAWLPRIWIPNDWLQVLDSVKDKKHMEQVAFLKEQHEFGHGHANALVAFYRAQQGA
ncbi:DUF4287 domain-containing protein [Achromobacter agilis]